MDLIYIISIWLLPLLVAITFHETDQGPGTLRRKTIIGWQSAAFSAASRLVD